MKEALSSSLHSHNHFCKPDKLTHIRANLNKKLKQYQLPNLSVRASLEYLHHRIFWQQSGLELLMDLDAFFGLVCFAIDHFSLCTKHNLPEQQLV